MIDRLDKCFCHLNLLFGYKYSEKDVRSRQNGIGHVKNLFATGIGRSDAGDKKNGGRAIESIRSRHSYWCFRVDVLFVLKITGDGISRLFIRSPFNSGMFVIQTLEKKNIDTFFQAPSASNFLGFAFIAVGFAISIYSELSQLSNVYSSGYEHCCTLEISIISVQFSHGS